MRIRNRFPTISVEVIRIGKRLRRWREILSSIFFLKIRKDNEMDKEKMININASLVEEPVFSSFEKDGEEVKVANFTLVKKYGAGKEYTKCSVYGEKSEMAKDFKKGDFIHVFGYFKERAKEDKVFKNFIVKSLNKIENKNKIEDNKGEN